MGFEWLPIKIWSFLHYKEVVGSLCTPRRFLLGLKSLDMGKENFRNVEKIIAVGNLGV